MGKIKNMVSEKLQDMKANGETPPEPGEDPG